MLYVDNYSEKELREYIEHDGEKVGGTHPALTLIGPASLALCPTTKCSKWC